MRRMRPAQVKMRSRFAGAEDDPTMPTRRTVLAGVLSGLVSARSALSLPDLSRPMVRIPIDVTESGLAIVSADIDGRLLRFVIDTGA